MQRVGDMPLAGRVADRLERARSERRSLMAAIHIRAKALGMREDDRRDMQERLTGRRSCADMTTAQLRRVADELRLAERRLRPGPVDATRPRDSREPMRRRALALAESFGAGERYLDAIARRQSGVAFRDADPQQLRGVIAAVWRQAKRRKVARAVG